jgi:nitrogen-specific signal transduction histidine kinase/CheY-like chemotaxis protein
VNSSKAPLKRGREVIGVLGIYEDVTERKQLEAQLRQAQKLEAIGQLAGGVAHDFNNILAAMMMHLGLLQMKTALDLETRQSLNDLAGEARRAASLTSQLLMFSRRSALVVRPLHLNELTANLLKMLTRLIGENITLNFESGSHLPLVEADAGMLEQVLMNLVVNARDAMPRGGRITISTSVVELNAQRAASNSERQVGQFVCLAVSDTGTGMDETTMKRIFEPFFTTKEVGKGTGLGLATAHGIIAQHKGWVEVESKVGVGTTFRVFLPAVETVADQTPQEGSLQPMRRGRETILLVEDEDELRQMVARTLRILGYIVYEATNGPEALVLWEKRGGEVDLLFTDMVMPGGVTGLELMERLQRLKPDLKVIISSGYSAEIAQIGVPDKTGVVYLPKPYEARTLAEVVSDCLKKA